MYENPTYIYNTFAVEQERIDRANERRRIVAENPDRVVPRERSFSRRLRAWFGARHADAASPTASDDVRVGHGDRAARPVHAR
jgi:hypothetical protein